MDKQNLIIVLEECFNEVGNIAILHFNDGSELMVDSKPKHFSSHMKVEINYDLNGENIFEQFIIPYTSVLYVTISSINNLKILAKQHEPLKENEDVFFYDKLTEEIE